MSDVSSVDPRARSAHQLRVEAMMRGIGRPVGERPAPADPALQLVWARLLLEETLEAIQAAGVRVWPVGRGDLDPTLSNLGLGLASGHAVSLPELAKELADVSVVAIGFMSLNGISDQGVLLAVDENNILKINTGKQNPVTGKFEKHPSHPKPDVAAVVRRQQED